MGPTVPTSTESELRLEMSEQEQEESRGSPQSEHTSLSSRSLRHIAHIPTEEDEGCFRHGGSDVKASEISIALPLSFIVYMLFALLFLGR